MLRPAHMKKTRVLSLHEYRDTLIRRIHELGCIEITRVAESEETAPSPILKSLPPDPEGSAVSDLISSLNRILEILSGVETFGERGFFASLFSSAPPPRSTVQPLSRPELVRQAETTVQEIGPDVFSRSNSIHDRQEEIQKMQDRRESLRLISGLTGDFSLLNGLKNLTPLVGRISSAAWPEARELIESSTRGAYLLEKTASGKKEFVVAILVFNDVIESLSPDLRRLGFERLHVEFIRGRAAETLEECHRKIESLNEEIHQITGELREIARARGRELRVLRELLEIEQEQLEAQNDTSGTRTVFLLEGWCPLKKVKTLTRELSDVTDGHVVVETRDPAPGDQVPIQLENPGILRPFELLTRLYGLPSYGGIDPTPFLAPGFLLFFGIMLGDTVYGLLTALLGWLILRGGGRHQPLLRDAGILLIWGGGFASFFGILTLSWLGEIIPKYLPLAKSLSLIDPMQEVTVFLIAVLVIGLIHLNIGVLIQIADAAIQKKYRNILKGDLWFLLAQPAIFSFAVGRSTLGLIFLAPALVLLLVSKGPMFLFGVTGFLGDNLSYARLMALGLCTTGIALTVNQLAELLGKFGIIGIFMAVVIFIIGHVFNWAINCLGAFVHGIRLNFVEFFTKFYESGGDAFQPFVMKRQVTITAE